MTAIDYTNTSSTEISRLRRSAIECLTATGPGGATRSTNFFMMSTLVMLSDTVI